MPAMCRRQLAFETVKQSPVSSYTGSCLFSVACQYCFLVTKHIAGILVSEKQDTEILATTCEVMIQFCTVFSVLVSLTVSEVKTDQKFVKCEVRQGLDLSVGTSSLSPFAASQVLRSVEKVLFPPLCILLMFTGAVLFTDVSYQSYSSS
jgi:hypothetical protein